MTNPKVMLIDDQLSNLIAMEQVLESLNYSIEKHSRTSDALFSLAENPVHCIVVDVRMPEMTGLEFSEIVMGDPKLNHIPILLVTGKVFSSNQTAQALRLGVHDYLIKPVDPFVLRTKVRHLVEGSLWRTKYLSNCELIRKEILNQNWSSIPQDKIKERINRFKDAYVRLGGEL